MKSDKLTLAAACCLVAMLIFAFVSIKLVPGSRPDKFVMIGILVSAAGYIALRLKARCELKRERQDGG